MLCARWNCLRRWRRRTPICLPSSRPGKTRSRGLTLRSSHSGMSQGTRRWPTLSRSSWAVSKGLKTSRWISWTPSGKAFPSVRSCGDTRRDASSSGRSDPDSRSAFSGTAWMIPSRSVPWSSRKESGSPQISSSSINTKPGAATRPGRGSSGSSHGCTCLKTTTLKTGSALPRSTACPCAWANTSREPARPIKPPSCRP